MEEQRNTQIREGAGQVESKLNTEFIDWLRKWHMPILLVVAVLALGYVGYQRLEVARKQRVARAFSEYISATSPEALRSMADQYDGVRAVPELARLKAADIYLSSFRRGVKPGAQPSPENGQYAPEDLLSEGDGTALLNESAALYQQVLDATSTDQTKALQAINAAFGLAAVAESKGDLDAAKREYERVVTLAEWGGYPGQAEIAQERIQNLPELAQLPRIYAAAELPKKPEPPAPEPVPSTTPEPGVFDPGTLKLPDADGQTPAPAGEPTAEGKKEDAGAAPVPPPKPQ